MLDFLLAAPVYVVETASRTELRLRSPGTAVDAEEDPSVALSLLFHRARLVLRYEPRLSVTDFTSNPLLDFLHAGEISSQFEWQRFTLSLAERASYGHRSFTSYVPPTYELVVVGDNLQVVPVPSSILYASSESVVSVGIELSPRFNLGVSAAYVLDGGVDDASRRVQPWLYGPRGTVELGYQLSRSDSLATRFDAEFSHTDAGTGQAPRRTDILRGGEVWSRTWDPRNESNLGFGVAAVSSDLAHDEIKFYPVVGAGFRHTVPTGPRRERVELGATALFDTVLDRFSGFPDQRLGEAVEAIWFLPPYTFTAQLGRTDSIGSDVLQDVHATNGDAIARYQYTPNLAFEGGIRLVYQRFSSSPSTDGQGVPSTPEGVPIDTAPTPGVATGFNWLVFVAMDATLPDLRW